MIPSSKPHPCPVCGRTKDGDCRVNDAGLVLCHTHQGQGLKLGDPSPNGRYRFLKTSTEAQGFGLWKPADQWVERPGCGPQDRPTRLTTTTNNSAMATPHPLALQKSSHEDSERHNPEQLTGPQLLAFIEKSYSIEWNLLKQRPIINGSMPRGRDKKLFYLDISSRFPDVRAKKDEAQDALDYVALKNAFNPIRRYIDGLEARASRGELQLLKLDEIAVKGFGIADDDWLSKSLLARKLVQQLKRGLAYGYKADEMLILQGGQGDYKTEAIKALAPQPDWVSTETELSDTNDWKFLLKISQSWIFLFDECDKFLRGKDSATLKSIVSNTHDSYAAKGLNEVDDHPRPSTMWGTTNEQNLFNDHTGVRRWWLVRVGDGRRCDPGWIQLNRDSIWATAYTWAMWGLESYLPRGSDEAEAAKARAWGATYSLDDDGDYLQRLSAIPIDSSTDLPSPIAKSDLIKEVSEIDTKRLWQTDRKRARDLQADVTRIVTASHARTHDGQIRWDERKGRVPGHFNSVRAFYPVRVAAEAEQHPAAADFQVDPIPRVPICSDAVPMVRNGQNPWQDCFLTSLFQCSNKKKKSIDQESAPGPGPVPGDRPEKDPYPEKIGTLEQEPEKSVTARRLPVPNFGTFKAPLSEQAGDSGADTGTTAVLPDQHQAEPAPDLAGDAAALAEPSPVPADLLHKRQQHLQTNPVRISAAPLADDLAAFLNSTQPSPLPTDQDDTQQDNQAGSGDPEADLLHLDELLTSNTWQLLEQMLWAPSPAHPLDQPRPTDSMPAASASAGPADFNPTTWAATLLSHKQTALRLHLQHPSKPPAALINSVFAQDPTTPSAFSGGALKTFLQSPEAQAWIAAQTQQEAA